MKYRSEIDGLRALAVVMVIFFHCDVMLFKGGFVGVDIFFVISGYLITSIVIDEIDKNRFSISAFYKRRIARLAPSLIITLTVVLVFGGFFYNSITYDNLGKEIFFSSLGMANILYAKGVNYFVQDASYRPLLHMWSLGVEEQFYMIWPFVLIFGIKRSFKVFFVWIVVLFIVSIAYSEYILKIEPVKAYYLLHARAFELLAGSLLAMLIYKNYFVVNKKFSEILAVLGVVIMLMSATVFDRQSSFPGINALLPVLGALLFIAFSEDTNIGKMFSRKTVVTIGLISYPLYLYHQPVISFFEFFFDLKEYSYTLLLLVFIVSTPLAWATYKYIEQPIRRLAHKEKNRISSRILFLLLPLFFLALSGAYIAKSDGVPQRYRILNPFAYEISKMHKLTFPEYFERGYSVKEGREGRILFFGDSLMQQYVYPIANALGVSLNDVDVVSRGGCVLLKGVDFHDKYADISCNHLYDELYGIRKRYEYVVFSQSWSSYGDSVKNFKKKNKFERWEEFVKRTIDHFLLYADKIIIIGPHISVGGAENLQQGIYTSEKKYRERLKFLKVTNEKDMIRGDMIFEKFINDRKNVILISTNRLWKEKNVYVLHDEWSYFRDAHHITKASEKFIEKRLMEEFDDNQR